MCFNKFGTKWYQNRQSLLNNVFLMPCEMQHANTCHKRRQATSRKFKDHQNRFRHLNETSCKVRKRMDQQCSAIVKHWTMSTIQTVCDRNFTLQFFDSRVTCMIMRVVTEAAASYCCSWRRHSANEQWPQAATCRLLWQPRIHCAVWNHARGICAAQRQSADVPRINQTLGHTHRSTLRLLLFKLRLC